jgi:lysozyme
MTQPLATAITNTNPNSSVIVQTNRLGKPWTASDQVKTFIGFWESGRIEGITRILLPNHHTHIDVPVSGGMILQVYLDDKDNPTVGCGHLVLPEDHLQVGQIISVERAREFLDKNLRETESAINSKVKVPLYQYEYDALVSIVFNTGPGAAADEMAHRVNQGDYENIEQYITTFRSHSNGAQRRRQSEGRLFAQGVYDASH